MSVFQPFHYIEWPVFARASKCCSCAIVQLHTILLSLRKVLICVYQNQKSHAFLQFLHVFTSFISLFGSLLCIFLRQIFKKKVLTTQENLLLEGLVFACPFLYGLTLDYIFWMPSGLVGNRPWEPSQGALIYFSRCDKLTGRM